MKLMMSNISSLISDRHYFFFALILVVVSATVRAESCDPLPGNEYEKVFCQLKRSGKGGGLPSIYDFRKNPPLTQAFLLKKPAERAGISIRIPERDNMETVSRQADLLMGVPELAVDKKTVKPLVPVAVVPVPSSPEPAVVPPAAPSVKAVNPVVAERAVAIERMVTLAEPSDRFSSCTLMEFELHCVHGNFRLVTNRVNQHLEEGVLSDDHKLNLPVFTGKISDRDAVERYLQQAYGRYLEGMMEIGLGASTMSYTKFVHLYDHITGQQLDFVARFETMYHFLKQDKASIGVSTKPVIATGFTTRYCSELTPELLACEHQRDNHVFLRVKAPG